MRKAFQITAELLENPSQFPFLETRNSLKTEAEQDNPLPRK